LKILAGSFIYNERDYLPECIEYYTSQGCDLIFVDNYSTDGSYEYLVKRGVNVVRFDTGGAFHLTKLQSKLLEQVYSIKPDWFVLMAPDTFQIFSGTIKNTIEICEKCGHNLIQTQLINMHNTGEDFKLPLYKNFFYGEKIKYIKMIGKVSSSLKIGSDNLLVANSNTLTSGITVNYGGCKPAKEKDEVLERRQKAWDQGLGIGLGGHYRRGKKLNWKRNKKGLLHIPNTDYWDLLKKL
jgi:glycosyltransferase involved in cell wall biosynthesis